MTDRAANDHSNVIYKLRELRSALLRDGDSDADLSDVTDLDAVVRSGLYFATLATELDAIRQHLKPGSENERKIERLIEDLFKLQDSYKIVPTK